MMKKSLYLAIVLCLLSAIEAFSQNFQDDTFNNQHYEWQFGTTNEKQNLLSNINYLCEIQASASDGSTPLWLNANKHGLSSLESLNGYFRVNLERPLSTDDNRHWGLGYAVDVVEAFHYTKSTFIQQAYIEGRWNHGVLTIGQKDYPLELRNDSLSSGSQTLGINARSFPQVRLALPRYWAIPGFNKWLHVKGHVAFGMQTDDSWQHTFTNCESHYVDNALYHSKAGYLKIGKEYYPLSLELGLEMACQFGGTPYTYGMDGKFGPQPTEGGIKAFWHAFIPGGSDATDGMYSNASGNQLGSYVMRLNYEEEDWALSFYADHFFEDHSQMFFTGNNGYQLGENWNSMAERKYFLYKFKDIMLGTELRLRHSRWLNDIVFEYIYTKYQSGPVYHDHSSTLSEQYTGMDNYYNHSNYNGWQHWGQVIGNPLYRSPIYNTDGIIEVKNNRFKAFHLGFCGNPTESLSYRILASWQDGLGRYDDPYTKPLHNISVMAEATYHLPNDWHIKGAWGMDSGSILGNNMGGQITVSKTGIFKLSK